ncbi:MAG: hypothetical protein AM1032_000136 [Mycoplasmataceae bacterium]|nr:MAG: hypothetical protein AM1032_000136 [Mycoplasmataceae bacterium]
MNKEEKQREFEWNKDEIDEKYDPSPLFLLESSLILFITHIYEKFNCYLKNKNQDYIFFKQFISFLMFIFLIYFINLFFNNDNDKNKDSKYVYFESVIDKITEKIENKDFISYCRRCNKNIYKGDKFIKKSNRFGFFSKWEPFHNSLFCKNCIKYEIYERKRSFKEDILATLDICIFIIPFKLLDNFFFKIKEEDCNIRNQFFLNKLVFFGLYLFIVVFFFDNYKYDFVE